MNFDPQPDDSRQVIKGLVISLVGLLCIPLVIAIVVLVLEYFRK